MPNHIHGIIIINKPDDGHNDRVETHDYASLLKMHDKNYKQTYLKS
jgi:REP element-mobilizing transposase RayT